MIKVPMEGEPASKRTKEELLAELAARREAREIAPEDYNTNELLWLIEMDQPLDAQDLGNHALVLTRQELEALGTFDITLKNGEITTLDTENFEGEILIIYPEDLE